MSSMYDAEDLDSEMVLIPQIQDLHVSLIQEDIKMQIENPFESGNDFVEAFNEQCEDALEEDDYSDDVMKRVNEERIKFYIDVIELISDKFHLDCDLDTIADKRVDLIDDICSAMYSFFVLKRKKNIKNMMLNYILEHEDQIAESLEYLKSKKDVVTVETRTKLEDENLSMFLANIQSVLRYVKSLNNSMDEMIQYTNLELFNNAMIQSLLENAVINCNFQELYFAPLFSYQDTIYDEIVSKIENGIVKVARKRRKVDG